MTGESILSVLGGLWKTLATRRRRKLLFLVALTAFAGVLEMAGIGILLPIMGLFQGSDRAANNYVFVQVSAALGNPGSETVLLIVLGMLLGYYLLKNLFLVSLEVFQYRTLARIQSDWATRLLSSYFNRPYEYHLQVNSAQLIRNVTTEVGTVLYYVLVPAASVLAEAFVISALLILLVFLDPAVAAFFLLSGGIVLALFYQSFKERSYQIGKSLQDSSADMIQHAKEGFGGIKEIKVMGREAFFEESFGGHVAIYARAWSRSLVLYKLPTHVIEVVFVTIFSGLLAFLTLRHASGGAFPLLAVYAAAAFRLIPSLNRIVTSMSLIKQGTASTTLVATELLRIERSGKREERDPLPFATSIDVRNLSFRHSGAVADSISDVSLSISKGEMIGFAGKSGSGKTTLVDCLIGLLVPTSGSVSVDGRDIREHLRGWQQKIGYIPQHIYLTDDTLRRNIALGLSDPEIDERRIAGSVEAAQLTELVDALPSGLDTFVGEHGVRLSGGQRQRIGIARALYHNPDVLIMDEATSALDAVTEQAIVRTVTGLKGSRTIVIISHRLETMTACDRIVELEAGHVAS